MRDFGWDTKGWVVYNRHNPCECRYKDSWFGMHTKFGSTYGGSRDRYPIGVGFHLIQTEAEVAVTGERVTSIGFQSQQLCWEPASAKNPLYGAGLEARTPEVGVKMLTNNAQTSNLWEGRVVFPSDQAGDVEYSEYFTVATSRFRSMKCNGKRR